MTLYPRNTLLLGGKNKICLGDSFHVHKLGLGHFEPSPSSRIGCHKDHDRLSKLTKSKSWSMTYK